MTDQTALSPTSDAWLHLLPLRKPRVRRTLQLVTGLVFFGVSLAMAVEAQLGGDPWTVFHEGASDWTGISFGTTVILTGAVILIAIVLLREPLGLGTLLNVLLIGPVADIALWVIPDLTSMWIRLPLIATAPIVLGFGSGLYLGAGVGPGPRDGLMTALNRRGLRTWVARTTIELAALAVGWVLGGTIGLGTAWMALSVGPFVQFFLPRFRIDRHLAAESMP